MSEHHECVRTGPGPNDFRLVLRTPSIQTCDSVPLLSVDLSKIDPQLRNGVKECVDHANSLIRSQNATRAALGTRDDVPLGERRPGDETVGYIVYPAPVKRYDLGKVWTNLQEATTLDGFRSSLRALDEQLKAVAEKLARGDAAKGDASDMPMHMTGDSAARGSLTSRAAGAAERYAASLKSGRKAADVAAPAKVKTGGDYAANLAAGRAAKARGG